MTRPVTRAQVSAALAAGWGRVAFLRGKGAMVDAVGCDLRTINRALTGDTVPDLVTALNSLAFDATALDEVLALVGGRFAQVDGAEAQPLALATALSGALADCLARMDDGALCHVDRAALTRQFRPLVQRLLGFIDADDARAGLRPVAGRGAA